MTGSVPERSGLLTIGISRIGPAYCGSEVFDEGHGGLTVHKTEAGLVPGRAWNGGGGILQRRPDSTGPASGRFSSRQATTPLTSAAAKEVPNSSP